MTSSRRSAKWLCICSVGVVAGAATTATLAGATVAQLGIGWMLLGAEALGALGVGLGLACLRLLPRQQIGASLLRDHAIRQADAAVSEVSGVTQVPTHVTQRRRLRTLDGSVLGYKGPVTLYESEDWPSIEQEAREYFRGRHSSGE